MQLESVTHAWNDEARPLGVANIEQPTLGFIAQDVQRVLPELVVEGADGFQRINYARMASVPEEGIKAQQAQLETVRGRSPWRPGFPPRATAYPRTGHPNPSQSY